MSRHTIEACEKAVLKIFCDDYVFRIPSYQRPYAWTTEQTGELLDDIKTACGDTLKPEEQSPYFLGSVVLIKNPHRPDADVVDGQQRLTTLTILMAVLRDLADEALRPFAHAYVCQAGNPIQGSSDVFRLTPRDRDAEFFREAIQSMGATNTLPDARPLKDSRARMVENAAFLREKLTLLDKEERRRLIVYVAQRCYLVLVAASDQESAFRIFSVLNSRGLDLSPADILKADIIGRLPASEQDQYTAIWESCEDELGRERFADLFGHIRTIHRKQKLKETLVKEFREYVHTAKEPANFICRELLPYADAYQEITVRGFQSFAHADAVNRQLTHLARLDNVDWQPPAIEVIANRRSDPDFVRRFLVDLERLAYGLFIARRDPSDRIRRYGRLLAAIQNGEDLFSESSPLQLDDTEKGEVRATLAGDIYPITRIRLPLLLRLDELISQGSATYTHAINSVEHVLPQNPAPGSQWMIDFPSPELRAEWVHKLANLVLLTRRKNAQASNYDFVAKKERYFSAAGGVSNFALTSKVLSEPAWTEDVLIRRQSELLSAIQSLWRLT